MNATKRTKITYRPNRGVRHPVRALRLSYQAGRGLAGGDMAGIADYRRCRNRRRDRLARFAAQETVVRGL